MFGATSEYRTDGDAGLMQVGARYYDAQVGRFVTRDTLLNQHPYVYCEGDPVNSVDPSGHWFLIVLAIVVVLACTGCPEKQDDPEPPEPPYIAPDENNPYRSKPMPGQGTAFPPLSQPPPKWSDPGYPPERIAPPDLPIGPGLPDFPDE